MLAQQIAVVGYPLLAGQIRMQKKLARFHLAVAEGPVEGIDRKGSLHPLIQRSADDSAHEQINPDFKAHLTVRHGEVPPEPEAISSTGSTFCWAVNRQLALVGSSSMDNLGGIA